MNASPAGAPAAHPGRSADCDWDRPNVARMYNYLLGGEDHGLADRKAIDQVLPFVPDLPMMAWVNRGFHQRAAIWMARQGITQFLDLGCGLPAREATHQAADRVAPGVQVAYVDCDPYVIARTRERSATDPRIAVLHGDVRDPEAILTDPVLATVIDLSRPCGLLLTGVLHFIPDSDDPWRQAARLRDALAPGSYLALSHATTDAMPPGTIAALTDAYDHANTQLHLRTRHDTERLLTGLDILAPYTDADAKVCRIGLWACDDPATASDESSQSAWCAVARRS